MTDDEIQAMSDADLTGLLSQIAIEQTHRVEIEQDAVRVRIASRIAALRKERGLRQEDLAEMIGRSRTTVVNIEAGRQGTPLELLVAIAHALRTTAPELIIKDSADYAE